MSTARTYTPKPGSGAQRAIAHLETLIAGSEVSTALLAEAIDCESAQLNAFLKPALEAGAIAARQKGGHARSPRFWSLVDHGARAERAQVQACRPEDRAMLATPAGAEMVGRVVKAMNGSQNPERLVSQHVLKAEAARPDATDRDAPATTSPVGGPMGTVQPAAAGHAGMRIALWSDGTLQIERSTVGGAAALVLLSADETRALVRYLERLAVDEEVAA